MSGKVFPLQDNQRDGGGACRQRLALRQRGHRQDAGAVRPRAAAAADRTGHARPDPLPHLHQGGRGGNGHAGERGAGELGADEARGIGRRSPRHRRAGRRCNHRPRPFSCSPACSIVPAAASGSIPSTPSRNGCWRLSRRKQGWSPAPARWRIATANCSQAGCCANWCSNGKRAIRRQLRRSKCCRCGWGMTAQEAG